MSKAVTFLLDEKVYQIIQKLNKGKFSWTVSDFIRTAVNNEIKSISKNETRYRLIDDDIVEIDYFCPFCNSHDVIHLRFMSEKDNDELKDDMIKMFSSTKFEEI